MIFIMNDFNKYLNETGETGFVEEMTQSIAQVSGLPGAKLSELVVFEEGEMGQVMGLGQDRVEVLVLVRSGVKVGARVVRTGGPLRIAVGEAMLGKIVDGLGRGAEGEETRMVDVTPSGISARKKISRPLETGIALVDLLVPLGRGQRELVMGDRKIGKTNFVLQAILAQSRLGTVCVYAAIGKKNTEIMQAESFFNKTGAIKNLVIVASSSHDTVGEIWLTPYTAMTVAEYFRDQGRDVLLVLDDMTAHAKFYRELSLTARRFPGRESYPGDIFYVHSKLLERAGCFLVPNTSPSVATGPSPVTGEGNARGEVSQVGEAAITCLPVVDTVQGDMTGYIQTNLMSMTDGHIFFDSDLYFAGRRPAINPFVSVTRVGYQTQSHIRRALGREIVKRLNDYEKTQSFVRFGAELGDAARQVLTIGEHFLKLFNQPMQVTMAQDVQTVAAAMVLAGLWDGSEAEVLQERYDKDEVLRREMKEAVDKAATTEQLIAAGREKQWLTKS
ncbi:MAG: ATP synthase subunit alpha [Candidatus Amesbacteria bacterium GW2011_GWB1_47_26]|nr:MAG: ATP synthase subunit alpha [Candidatus Amesbacteria bacterium GW2011_GWB1_47_26]